ncbi:MAG TPA: hypothetical protein VIB48_03995 [Acidimicrobiia bacterium]|jgi:hypothetical protein
MTTVVSSRTAVNALAPRITAPAYRVFQVVYALLTVQFAVLGVSYLADPGGAVHTFSTWNQHLGGIRLLAPDVPPWRYATAVGMTTLALMCLMALLDLRRNHPVVAPAAFFKAYNAVLWFWYANHRMPVFVAAGVLDVVEAVVMVVVATAAYRTLRAAERAS